MAERNIVITYKISEERRTLVKELLGREGRLTYLVDMPPGLRQQTLIGADILLSWNLPRELGPSELGLLQNVKLIQLLSAGADAVPYSGLPNSVVIAGNVGAYAEPMAEHVLAMALALLKNLHREHQKMAEGEFDQKTLNRMLRGSVCAILGFGGIGKATARLMRALGVRVHAVNTSGRTDEPVDFIGTMNDLRQVLSRADIVVISLPLTKATNGLIGKRELGWMKPDAVLINVARGDIVKETALYEHLVSHPDFRAGIDVWWVEPFKYGEFRTSYPFLTLPNFLGSPHNSAIVPGITEEATQRAAENVKKFLKGEPIRGVVRREEYV